MTNKDYHAHSAISKSDIDLFLQSPKKFALKKAGKLASDDSPALLLGSAVHKLILEPNDFESEFIVEPRIDKRSKEGKAAYSDFLELAFGKSILSPMLYEQARAMAKAVLANKTAQKFITEGFAEKSFFSTYQGAEIKCRPDYYNQKLGLVVDIKTSANASEFGKSIGNFNYHIQQALYSDILMANGLSVNGFVFVVVEKTAPYMVGFFTLSEKAVEFGRECYQNALDKIIALKAQKLEFPDFAGLSIDENGQINQKIIQEIDLPAWVYSKGA